MDRGTGITCCGIGSIMNRTESSGHINQVDGPQSGGLESAITSTMQGIGSGSTSQASRSGIKPGSGGVSSTTPRLGG